MGLYLAVVRGSFRRYAAYRAANWGRLGANTAFGFILAYTYLALWNVRPHLGGEQPADGPDGQAHQSGPCRDHHDPPHAR